MLGEVTTVYVFLIELGSLLLYCYRVFGVRRRIPSTLLMGIACFAVYYAVNKLRFLYNGIIIKHQKTEPTYTKTSLFLCEKRRFFMARREKGVVPIIYFEKERGKSF